MKSIDNESEREKLERLYGQRQSTPGRMQRLHPTRRDFGDPDSEKLDDPDFEYESHSTGSGKRRIPRAFELKSSEEGCRAKKSSSGKSLFWGIIASTLFLAGGYLANPENQIYKATPFTVPTTTPVQWQLDPQPRLGNAALVHKRMQEGQVNVTKSTITGIVDSNTMTASLYWTMVLKNNNTEDKEAAITMDLPKNSALSRATLWVNGVAQEAAFSARDAVQQAYDRIVVMHRDPLLITQSGPNRIKILAAPVTARGGEMQIRVGITVPVERSDNGRFILHMPSVAESNLKFDSRQDIHLSSDTPISGVGRTEESGIYLLKANISDADLKHTEVSVAAPASERFATRLTHTNPSEYVLGELKEGRLNLTRVSQKPDCRFIAEEDAAFRLSHLWAYREIERLAAHGDSFNACRLANIYRIVSSVSGAAVLELESDYSASGLNRNAYQVMNKRAPAKPARISVRRRSISGGRGGAAESAEQAFIVDRREAFAPVPPAPQAARVLTEIEFNSSSGQSSAPDSAISDRQAPSSTFSPDSSAAIGPMGGDATIVQGINTAGTLRVNNLALLEQLLSGLSYVLQLAGIGIGVFLASESIHRGALKLGSMSLSKGQGLAAALTIATVGICSPQFINWVLSSLRDANILS